MCLKFSCSCSFLASTTNRGEEKKTCPSFVTHELNGRLSRRRQQKKKGKCKSFFSLRTSNAPSSYQISRLTSGYKLILRALSFKTLNYYDNALRANYKAQGPVIVHSTTISIIIQRVDLRIHLPFYITFRSLLSTFH